MRQEGTGLHDARLGMTGESFAGAAAVGSIAIIASALHFWPFEGDRLWQLLSPSNLAVVSWMAILGIQAVCLHHRHRWGHLWPHVSLLAYLGINLTSMAFADDLARSGNYTMKLLLTLLGGYVLFRASAHNEGSRVWLYWSAGIAGWLAVSASLIARYGFGADRFGFFENTYKYGTYIGLIVPPACVYWLLHAGTPLKLIGGALLMGAIVSVGSMGPVIGLLFAMLYVIAIVPGRSTRLWIALPLLGGLLGSFLLSGHHTHCLRADLQLREGDSAHLRQRYIEWQATINLLGPRTVCGTGAGCIDIHRSSFYHRLLKFNTLEPFDQNGWLVTMGETGIWGTVCLLWILLHHMGNAWRTAWTWRGDAGSSSRFAQAVAGGAGLISACVVNAFSSVCYNGILIAFVLLLALTAVPGSRGGTDLHERP